MSDLFDLYPSEASELVKARNAYELALMRLEEAERAAQENGWEAKQSLDEAWTEARKAEVRLRNAETAEMGLRRKETPPCCE